MFLIDMNNIIYTCVFLFSFLVCFFVMMYTNIERLFKQGAIWQIRIMQVIIAFILAYFIAKGVLSLINAAIA